MELPSLTPADWSILVTDVGVRCTDAQSRRTFERYGAVVGPCVSAMGQPVLRLVQREAGRAASRDRAEQAGP